MEDPSKLILTYLREVADQSKSDEQRLKYLQKARTALCVDPDEINHCWITTLSFTRAAPAFLVLPFLEWIGEICLRDYGRFEDTIPLILDLAEREHQSSIQNAGIIFAGRSYTSAVKWMITKSSLDLDRAEKTWSKLGDLKHHFSKALAEDLRTRDSTTGCRERMYKFVETVVICQSRRHPKVVASSTDSWNSLDIPEQFSVVERSTVETEADALFTILTTALLQNLSSIDIMAILACLINIIKCRPQFIPSTMFAVAKLTESLATHTAVTRISILKYLEAGFSSVFKLYNVSKNAELAGDCDRFVTSLKAVKNFEESSYKLRSTESKVTKTKPRFAPVSCMPEIKKVLLEPCHPRHSVTISVEKPAPSNNGAGSGVNGPIMMVNYADPVTQLKLDPRLRGRQQFHADSSPINLPRLPENINSMKEPVHIEESLFDGHLVNLTEDHMDTNFVTTTLLAKLPTESELELLLLPQVTFDASSDNNPELLNGCKISVKKRPASSGTEVRIESDCITRCKPDLQGSAANAAFPCLEEQSGLHTTHILPALVPEIPSNQEADRLVVTPAQQSETIQLPSDLVKPVRKVKARRTINLSRVKEREAEEQRGDKRSRTDLVPGTAATGRMKKKKPTKQTINLSVLKTPNLTVTGHARNGNDQRPQLTSHNALNTTNTHGVLSGNIRTRLGAPFTNYAKVTPGVSKVQKRPVHGRLGLCSPQKSVPRNLKNIHKSNLVQRCNNICANRGKADVFSRLG